MNLNEWPNCIIPGCINKCCLRLQSPRCYPHTLGLNADSFAAAIDVQTETPALAAVDRGEA